MNKIHKITWSATLLAILALALPARATLLNIVCNPADYTCQPSGVNNPVASTTDAIGFAGAPGSSWCAILMFPLPTLPAGKQIGPQTTMAVNLNAVGASTTINADVWGVANFRTALPGSTPDSTYSYYLVNNTGPGNNATVTDVKLVDNFLTPSLVGKAGIYVMTPTGTTNNLQAYIQSFYSNNPAYDASIAQAYVWLRINSDTASTSTANRYIINAGDSGVTSTLRPVLNLDIVDAPTNTLAWNGNASAVWDISTTANWKSNGITGLTYQDGADTIFDDTLSANPAITLNTTVSPASTLINASTNYTFSGTGKISGTGSLTKAGTGTAILDTDNDYSGPTFIAGGTLQVGNGDTHGSLGSGPVTNTGVGSVLAFNRTDAITVNTIVTRSYQYSATVVVNSGIVNLAGAGDNSGTLAVVNTNGTLVLAKASGSTAHTLGSSSIINPGGTMQLGGSGGDQIFQNAFITNNGTFDMAGMNEGINGLFGNGIVTNSVATPSTLALGDGNGSATFSGVIKDGVGTVAITKTGTGTQTLTGTNNTYSGTTTISAGVLAVSTGISGGIFNVANNATLGINTVSSNGTFTANTVTLGNSKINLQILNSTTVAPLSIANLVLNGTVTINITSTNTFFPSQSYPLVGFTNLTGSASSFVLGTVPSGVSGTLDTSGNPIKFVVATVPVTWNGNVSGSWDVGTTPNWKFGTLTGLTYPDGDAATFDDTLAGTTNVILNANVSPLSVTFTNNTHGYLLTGPGNITGTGKFTKSGTNILVVDTDNDYIGGTVVLGGTLQIGNNDAHGTLGFGPTTNLTGGAIIAFNRTDTINVGTITRTTVDNSARVVVNSGTVVLGGAGDNAGTIGIVNNGGTLVLAKDSSGAVHALSSFSPFLQINSGGTMQLDGFGDDQIYTASGLTDNGVFNMAGHSEGFDSLTGNGLVTSSGSSVLQLGENNGSSTFSGAIVNGSGNLSLSKVGVGTLTLTGANTYTGDTLVSTGKLVTATASTGGGAYLINDAAALGVSVSTPNGSLVISSLTLGVSGNSTLEFQNLNSSSTAAITASSLALNSAVTVNVTSGTFVAGQNYPLLAYSSISGSGTFTLGTLPAGMVATLNTSASPIRLQVSSVVNPTPPIITTTVTNNVLTLQWPADHTGWLLQSNAAGLTFNDQWFSVPGSTTTNAIGLPIDPSATNVFYRLRF